MKSSARFSRLLALTWRDSRVFLVASAILFCSVVTAANARGEPSPLPLNGACSPTPTTLCLNNSRFSVAVSWRVPDQGRSGPGIAVPLRDDTGLFWFFDDSNIELVVKVLDGTGVNGSYWVFYAGLSEVEYTITVIDLENGRVRTYDNQSGSFASVADTSAFPNVLAPMREPVGTHEPALETRPSRENHHRHAG